MALAAYISEREFDFQWLVSAKLFSFKYKYSVALSDEDLPHFSYLF